VCRLAIDTRDLASHQATHRSEPVEPPRTTHYKRPCIVCHQLVPASDWLRHSRAHMRPVDTRARRAVRDEVFRRDGYRCQRCGRGREELAQLGLQLEAHHVNNLPADHRPENLVTLCSDGACHPRGDHLGNTPKSSGLIFTYKLGDISD